MTSSCFLAPSRRDLQDTFVPFLAVASDKLEAVAEADGDVSPEEPGAKPESKAKEGQEAEDKDAQEGAAETSPPASKTAGATPALEGDDEKPKASEPTAPAGENVEEPGASTVEPMSQEESLGGLDGLVDEGAKEPMSQEEAAGGLEGEPMSQSAPELLEDAKATTPAEEAQRSAEDDVLGRKRSAEQTAASSAQADGDQAVGVAMETDEANKGGGQAAGEGQEGGEGAAASGTCGSSDPSEGR